MMGRVPLRLLQRSLPRLCKPPGCLVSLSNKAPSSCCGIFSPLLFVSFVGLTEFLKIWIGRRTEEEGSVLGVWNHYG
jgi:hypothetical protein